MSLNIVVSLVLDSHFAGRSTWWILVQNNDKILPGSKVTRAIQILSRFFLRMSKIHLKNS